jgi:GH24 family phage-related lysozyme (muramidase)
MNIMKTSKKGIDLIKEFEGLRTNAYKCSANI